MKLMVRFVVTASGTMPISPKMATYSATSATVIKIGPNTVWPAQIAGTDLMGDVADPPPTSSTRQRALATRAPETRRSRF